MPRVMDYFETNGWKQHHLKEMKCSKDTAIGNCYLGAEKNEFGRNINCKGVLINVYNDNVFMGPFGQDGDFERFASTLRISEYGCVVM